MPLGGILRNYDSNLLLSATSPYSVIEADEFDRSFHRLTPYIAVITATDPDHLDIYGTEEAYLESFARFTELIMPGGTLIVHTGLKLKPRPADGVRVWSCGKTEGTSTPKTYAVATVALHSTCILLTASSVTSLPECLWKSTSRTPSLL